ncbi:MAG: hypothetical protein ACXVGB_00610 [Mycobacteriaceae bacterium]
MASSLPEVAYFTKKDSSGNSNIGYPGTQAQATAAEAIARTELAARDAATSVTGGSITLAR